MEQRRIGYVGPLEKNVPLPPSKRGRTLLRPQMSLMKVDESFVTSHSNTAVHRIAQKLGITCETRQEGDKIRVWRVK